MNVVVPVLGDMSDHGGGRLVSALHTEPIFERNCLGLPFDMRVEVIGQQFGRKKSTEENDHMNEQRWQRKISSQIGRHVRTRFMLTDST